LQDFRDPIKRFDKMSVWLLANPRNERLNVHSVGRYAEKKQAVRSFEVCDIGVVAVCLCYQSLEGM